MAAQMDYGYDIRKGVPGGKVDLTYDKVVTRRNEEADGKMVYGVAVTPGTNKGVDVKLPASSTDPIEGVTIALPNTEQDKDGKVVVTAGRSLSIMQKGHIWGRLATGATPSYGEKAYVVDSGDEAGYFTHTAGIDIGATFGKETDDGIAVIVL